MTTLLLLSLAGAAAAAPELVSILEAFDGSADALDMMAPPGPFSPGNLDIASAADGTLRLEYEYKMPAAGPAGVFVERFAPNSTTFACAGATHVALRYKVVNASTLPGSVHLRIGVQTKIGDDEDAGPPARRLQPSGPPGDGPPGGGPPGGGPGGPPSDGEPLAFFLWGNGFVLDEVTGEWQTLLVELCSGGSRSVDPFVDIGRAGTILDASDIRRWRIGAGMHGAPGETAQGSFLVDELSCVRDPSYSRAPGNCTAAPGACSEVGPVRFDINSPRARNRGYKPRQCCEACTADPTCVYWTTDATAKFTVADGEPEERVLFGDLVEAVVYYEDLDASFPGDEIRNKPTPDFRPGTSGLPRVAQRGRSVARSAARPSMLSSLRSSLSRSTKNFRHSSSDTQNHGLSPLSTSRSLPQALTRDSSLGGSSSKSPNSLVWTASAPRPVVPPSPHNEDRV
ncbi:unnamed protein product [Pelagomonas calceolata]|uniref:Uncharacterized protein n=2 Tax=Pelagomonas calceolata TaxID=35677 RepID=A0A8J2SG49_9STRA|nr:unnamed protein product [Pelagomonas calceolata]